MRTEMQRKTAQTQHKTDANAMQTQCQRRLRSTEKERELFIDHYCRNEPEKSTQTRQIWKNVKETTLHLQNYTADIW